MTGDLRTWLEQQDDLGVVPAVRVLSLWQPWASAMALGLKGNETRSWFTPYRGVLAIHAAKRDTKDLRLLARDHGLDWDSLPKGAIVGAGLLDACLQTHECRRHCSAREVSWGDYSDGRYALTVGGFRTFESPIPCRGHQGRPWLPEAWLREAILVNVLHASRSAV